MFNNGAKKESIDRMNASNKRLKDYSRYTMDKSKHLLKKREILKRNLESLWEKINQFRNKPEELNLKLSKVKIMYERYDDLIAKTQAETNDTKITTGAAGAGVAAGVGIAALGPTTAMAIATTFGTASTGTAISTLSGAAETYAALAWLGRGAIAAGGGGIAAGDTFLALAGPVGWGIAAVSLTAGGILKNSKNKKVTQEANEATAKLEAQIKIASATMKEIDLLELQTKNATTNVFNFMTEIRDYNENYNVLSTGEQYKLGAIVNDIYGYAKLLNKIIGKDGRVVDQEKLLS